MFRLWLTVLLLCAFPITGFRAQARLAVATVNKECVTKQDMQHCLMQQRQMPLAGAVVTSKTGERIGSPRPTRLHPTNGGKLGRTMGRWVSDSSFHISNLFALFFRSLGCGQGTSAVSPRSYYVIALRHLLC